MLPDHLILVLITVQDMSQVDAPDDVTVGSDACHEMPPSMTFQEEAPRHTDLSAPSSQVRAVDSIYAPDRETAQEDAESVCNKDPHRFQYARVSGIVDVLFLLHLQRKATTLSL